MLFNSTIFFYFYFIVLIFFFIFKKSRILQNILILAASYFFYAWWDPRFLYLITLSTSIDYLAGRLIDQNKIEKSTFLKSFIFSTISCYLFVFIKWHHPFNMASLINSDHIGHYSLWGSILFYVFLYPFSKFVKEGNLSDNTKDRIFLSISISANLLILGFFKYFNFFTDNLNELTQALFNYELNSFNLEIVLPVGISFYTFQTMSYTIDIYRKGLKSTSSFVDFAAYVCFFPQLVAGPIERAPKLLPQFLGEREKLTLNTIKDSIWLIFWGLYKKVVIADNLGRLVNNYFKPYDNLTANLPPENGLTTLLIIYAFAIQIYGDFSGYSDIARGTARLLGFRLMLNFNLPYFALGPSDFWKRWHISLSSWLRDYLYIGLGGNRCGNLCTYRNLLLTMLLGGLWHGAAWNFIIWGAFHGSILMIYRLFKINDDYKKCSNNQKVLKWFIMLQLTMAGWLVFRAQNIQTIVLFFKSIFTNFHFSGQSQAVFSYIISYSWFLLLFQIIQFIKDDLFPQRNFHAFVKFNIWLIISYSLFISLGSTTKQEFIYFAF